MRKKTENRHCLCLLLATALLFLSWGLYRPAPEAQPCLATGERYLIPVGQTVGIKLFAPGVLVVGFAEEDGTADCATPAERCGLQVGDMITEIDHQKVRSIEEVAAALRASEDNTIAIAALRGGRLLTLEATVLPDPTDGGWQLGAWIRDSMAGIGTVTYYDPSTGAFAALGHGITDVDTGELMPLGNGSIMSASVTGVLKGASGAPGQLHGSFDLGRDTGSLSANTDAGIFGTADQSVFPGEAIPVARRSQVTTGPATIRCNVSGDEVKEYQVEILRVYPEALSSTRNLMLRVTDPALLEATGGVVQGMSGSPILQNGRLVGAVTHVLLDDPTKGYGILAETMLEAAS